MIVAILPMLVAGLTVSVPIGTLGVGAAFLASIAGTIAPSFVIPHAGRQAQHRGDGSDHRDSVDVIHGNRSWLQDAHTVQLGQSGVSTPPYKVSAPRNSRQPDPGRCAAAQTVYRRDD
jgi:hypothetical protein